MKFSIFLILVFISPAVLSGGIEELYMAPQEGVHTRWVSPENPTGAVGAGVKTHWILSIAKLF